MLPDFSLNEWFTSENYLYVHLAVLISLTLGACGFPIPEDLPLILAGWAAARGIVRFQTIFLTCYLSVVFSDQIVYFIGYFFGARILKSKLFSRFPEEKINKIRSGLREKRFLYIFLGRHLFPLRSATFVTAGTLRIPFWEFFISDAIAALISVSIMLTLGYFLGDTMATEISKNIHTYSVLLVVVICLFFSLKWAKKKYFTDA